MIEKLTRSEIDEVKRRFVMENTRVAPPEAAKILGVSLRTFYCLVDEGHIETMPLRPGQVRYTRCTLAALEKYRLRVTESAQ